MLPLRVTAECGPRLYVRALADDPNQVALASVIFFNGQLEARVVRREDVDGPPGFVRKLSADMTHQVRSDLDCADPWMLHAHVSVEIRLPSLVE